MTISARYPGTCTTCGHPITPGQQIEWTKGSRPRHTACQSATTARVIPTAPRRITRCVNCGDPLDRWEQQHGVRRCADCRDGGSNARGGQSYYDRHGTFVLGDND